MTVVPGQTDATTLALDATTELTLTAVWGEGNQNLLAVTAARAAGTTAEGAS
jgi:hypothetical protein